MVGNWTPLLRLAVEFQQCCSIRQVKIKHHSSMDSSLLFTSPKFSYQLSEVFSCWDSWKSSERTKYQCSRLEFVYFGLCFGDYYHLGCGNCFPNITSKNSREFREWKWKNSVIFCSRCFVDDPICLRELYVLLRKCKNQCSILFLFFPSHEQFINLILCLTEILTYFNISLSLIEVT